MGIGSALHHIMEHTAHHVDMSVPLYRLKAAQRVLEEKLLEQIKDELAAVKPMPAVFDRQYVKRLDGPNVKKGKNKKDLADQLVADIRKFKADNHCDRVVVIWAGSTEVYCTESPCHQSLAAFEKGLQESDPAIAPRPLRITIERTSRSIPRSAASGSAQLQSKSASTASYFSSKKSAASKCVSPRTRSAPPPHVSSAPPRS